MYTSHRQEFMWTVKARTISDETDGTFANECSVLVGICPVVRQARIRDLNS